MSSDSGLEFLGLFLEGEVGLETDKIFGDDPDEELVEFVGERGQVLVLRLFIKQFGELSEVEVLGHEFLHGVEHGVLHHFEIGLGGGLGGLEKFLELLYHLGFVRVCLLFY